MLSLIVPLRYPSLVLLLLLPVLSPVYAANANWNCQRSKDGKEWVCVSGQGKVDTSSKERSGSKSPSPEAAGEAGTREPAPEEPVEGTRLAAPPPAERPRPGSRGKSTSTLPTKPEKPGAEPEEKPAGSGQSEKFAARSAPARQRPGWTCEANAEKDWDCELVGPDPKGQAHVVTDEGRRPVRRTATADITEADEQRFVSIMDVIKEDPWGNDCSKPSSSFFLSPQDRAARERAPVDVQSNFTEVYDEENASFSGSAEIKRADQTLLADHINYNTVSGAANAQGDVIYREKGLSFASDSAFLRLKSNQGTLRNTQFILETVPARGTSRVTHFDSNTLSRYEKVAFTSCPPGNQDWLLHARDIKIDKETGRGTATHAWLEFKNVPFLYAPLFTFPVDDRRQSGILAPTFAVSRISGFDLTVPYYWNIAPNYDATFSPRLLTNRGVLLRTEFRYLTRHSSGRSLLEYLPYDAKRQQARGQFGFLDNTRFSPNLLGNLNLNYVSDERYLNELGNPLYFLDRRFIASQANLTYIGSHYSLVSHADYYQTVDPTIPDIAKPYRRLPQLLLNYSRPVANTGLAFSGLGELVNFNREQTLTAQRLNLKPKLSYPLQTAWSFLTPSFSVQHTQYWLQNQQPFIANNLSRTTPILSVDSGLYFERDTQFFGSPLVQTLEPRLFYVYIPYQDQTKLPVLDTAQYDFNYYQLFRENRFVGSDRVGDANQVTLALTTRLIDHASGLERMRASLGEIYYFDERRVNQASVANCPESITSTESCRQFLAQTQPSVVEPRTEDLSNIIGQLNTLLTEHWSLGSGAQWNPNKSRIDRGQVSLQYRGQLNHLLNLTYRYRRDPLDRSVDDPFNQSLEQTDVSFRLPIAAGWYAIARWQYSLLHQVTVESFAGFERETCCWRFSLIGRHYINAVNNVNFLANNRAAFTNAANNGIFFQLELKGLTRFGDQVDQFLNRSISGYRIPDE